MVGTRQHKATQTTHTPITGGLASIQPLLVDGGESLGGVVMEGLLVASRHHRCRRPLAPLPTPAMLHANPFWGRMWISSQMRRWRQGWQQQQVAAVNRGVSH